jgi:hypothetical protein
LAYTITFDAAGGDEPRVLFVGDNTEPNGGASDLLLIDSLEAWGYKVTYFQDDDYRAIPPNHAEYNLMFFSESMSSQVSETFVNAGYPLPMLLMEPYAVLSSSNRLGIGDEAGPDEASRPDFTNTKTKVVNTDHPITEGIWDPNEEVTMMTEPIIQMYTKIKPEYDPVYLGEIEGHADLHSWVAIEPSGVLNHRVVLMTWFDGSAEAGTNDYWLMLQRSILWVLDDLGGPPVFTNAELDNGITIYPNPTQFDLSVEITLESEGQVQLSLKNLNGQLVTYKDVGFRPAGKNRIQMNLPGLKPGVYFLGVDGDGEIRYKRLVIK